uniref:Uncharacterized protein n=1 Tax=Heterorhabditis bacteriophora TaxID=37862 RepID=A0A1I7WCX0_HETBA
MYVRNKQQSNSQEYGTESVAEIRARNGRCYLKIVHFLNMVNYNIANTISFKYT